MTVFQQRLEYALTLRGMTAADLSRKSGVAEATISQYRSGYCQPKDKNLYKLCKALGVSPAWILGFDEADERVVNKALSDLLSLLTEEQQKQAEQYIRFLLANQKDEV